MLVSCFKEKPSYQKEEVQSTFYSDKKGHFVQAVILAMKEEISFIILPGPSPSALLFLIDWSEVKIPLTSRFCIQ